MIKLSKEHWLTVEDAKNEIILCGNHAEIIYSPAFFYNKLNYIHKNPVTDMTVSREEDYWFSSARNYAERDYLLEVILESSQLITY